MQQRAVIELRPRQEKGTERDVAGAYNSVFMSVKPTGRRTSLIVDPPDGRIPPMTAEVQKKMATEREYRLALLQATTTCKNQDPGCRGGKYGPPSPRRAEAPPRYSTGNINRVDNPEDRSMSERCMAAVLPDFTGFRRIVQSPGSVAIFYDVGQGQGWQRTHPRRRAPAPSRAHPPAVRRLAWPLGGRHAGRRRHQFQTHLGFHGIPREPAPDRTLDPHRPEHARLQSSRSTTRRRGRNRGPSRRNMAGRTSRRTGSTTSPGATRGITACRRCLPEGAPWTRRSPRDEDPIPPPSTTRQACKLRRTPLTR